MRTPKLHFGQTAVSAERDWDAARSFCLLRLSFAASCLSASNLRLSHCEAPALSVWGLLLPCLLADLRLCKLSLQLVFVTLSWSTTIALSFLKLAEDCFWHAYVFYHCGVASPAQLHLQLRNELTTTTKNTKTEEAVWMKLNPEGKDGFCTGFAAGVRKHFEVFLLFFCGQPDGDTAHWANNPKLPKRSGTAHAFSAVY